MDPPSGQGDKVLVTALGTAADDIKNVLVEEEERKDQADTKVGL